MGARRLLIHVTWMAWPTLATMVGPGHDGEPGGP